MERICVLKLAWHFYIGAKQELLGREKGSRWGCQKMLGYPRNGWYFGKQLRYLELFPDQHWSMSSYDPKERRKLATHAEGVPRFRFGHFELPSCLGLGMILGHLRWKLRAHNPTKKRGATLILSDTRFPERRQD